MDEAHRETNIPVDPMAEEGGAVRRLNTAGRRNNDLTTLGIAAAKAVKAGFDITNETTSKILGFAPIKPDTKK